MKRAARISLFFICIAILFINQSNVLEPMEPFDYKSAWEKVIKFENDGLPKSALEVVESIYNQAKTDQEHGHLVKAIIHLLKYNAHVEEDDFIKNLNRLRNETKTLSFPIKPVLHSMLAETYWNYYQANRYKFNQRSETIDFKNDDISTWSLEKLVHKTVENYDLSLNQPDKLKKVKIDEFSEILYGGNEKGKLYRPTLYDFLAHRAIDFFKHEEPNITRPADYFILNSADYFHQAAKFSKLHVKTSDTLSFKFHALTILQDLVRFHLNDKEPEALVDIELKRLEFVYHNSTLPDKQELYLKTLEELEQKTISHPVSTRVSYSIASIWGEKGQKYNPLESDIHKWDIKKAWDICNAAYKRFPESEGAAFAYNYQRSIMSKHIDVKFENVNIPDLPFRALLSYKNLEKVHWRVIKVTSNEVKQIHDKYFNNRKKDSEKEFLNYFLNKTPQAINEALIPDDGDLQMHRTEIKLNSLPVGEYMVIFSPGDNFSFDNNALVYSFITISNLSYIHRNLPDGTTEVSVRERKSGKPVPGAKIEISFQIYDYSASKYKLTKGGSYISDNNGTAKIPYQGKRNNRYSERNFFIDITWNNDKVGNRKIDQYNDYGNSISQYKAEKPATRKYVRFFLDRAIYRPGQTLYFKGLIYDSDGKTHQIKPNEKYEVIFYDVNHEITTKQKVTTNEYGTFSGNFTTPVNGLLGSMHLEVEGLNGNWAYFSVEEYKRPKFEVKFEQVKGSYRLDETIHTSGKAIAYSGAPIDGAEVKYRVVRAARFPFWYWCRYGYYPTSPEIEITNGTTTTDAQGVFNIDFKAIADKSVSKNSDPVFNFQVFADVTDINGETHSQQTFVNVGYKSLLVGVHVNQIDLSYQPDLERSYLISTSNLSGEFEPATGNIKIWKLDSPKKFFRNRMWEKPDKYVLSEEEFHKNFPNDLYADENNMYKWERRKEVLHVQFNTENKKEFKIKNIKSWDLGNYVLEITSKDKYGENVKEVSYFEVLNTKDDAPSKPTINSVIAKKISFEPGETATLTIGSSELIHALVEVEHEGKIIRQEWETLNNEKKVIEIPIAENYRGGLSVHYTIIKDSRLYYQTQNIEIPFTNKELDIKFETFRDKLEPGEKEQWKIKISGHKSDQVMAEMAATMYDASLDEFNTNYWNDFGHYFGGQKLWWQSINGFIMTYSRVYSPNWNRYKSKYVKGAEFSYLNWFGLQLYHPRQILSNSMAAGSVMRAKRASAVDDGFAEMEYDMVAEEKSEAPPAPIETERQELPPVDSDKSPKDVEGGEVQIRKNFNETAFFYPHLTTNKNGEVIISFTVPEALTRWKMLGFAHTKDFKTGVVTNELVTQKNLMVVPNQPRFFRENDKIMFSAKVTSMVDENLSGEARLEFFDALTMQPINDLMDNNNASHTFSIKPKQSTNLEWAIEIPEGIQAITYRIIAKAGNFSDGEEMTLPVVTNRMLVTETLPLPVNGKQSKTFTFDKLANSTSSTLKNHRYTLEFTSNPAWYAVQALPYMMEYPYECTEQVFSRFYANSIASHIANSNPKIKQVFDTWATVQPDAFLSNLEKNQELKSALLEETPWVLNAKNETQRKRNVALLFDLNKMSNELERALVKIRNAQVSNGAFVWFPGLPEDQYITQHIVAGMAHLDVMGVQSVRNDSETWSMIVRALGYLDKKMEERYQNLKYKASKGRLDLKKYQLNSLELQYLYTRSYFRDIDHKKAHIEGFEYFIGQTKKQWIHENIYLQGMIALFLHRFEQPEIPAKIIKSLNEKALHSEEMGMYWKTGSGYYWYEAPIERQALLIEVYDEVAGDQTAVEELKVWLLKQKQVSDWKTTRATSEACYALLRRGIDVLTSEKLVEIKIGEELIDPYKREDTKIEAGTGYFKTAWTASEITPEMGNIKVTKSDDGVAWGAVYWQYFEQLDKITPAETPLRLKKQLFVQENTDRGPVIRPVETNTKLKVGDLVKVRIELRVDRNMEYVHLKDMRACTFEPLETLSKRQYQDGLYYYESPRDLAMNFFIGYLPQGTYVFEYPLRVSQKGNFSNGITTIQCMYAPEFTSHSEGVRVTVE
jgi:uncharacterized protein YfaS (alpha-2-macroglobulin family)